MRAIQLCEPGAPDVLRCVEIDKPTPGETEVLVRAHSIGVGMPDILIRRGTYPWMPPLPAIPGIEMSGTIESVGRRVSSLRTGQPVFVSARELPHRGGCYAEYFVVEADAVFALPHGIDLEAAAALSNYQVAYHLLQSAAPGSAGRSVLVYAAAGGVGSAVVQLAKLAGLRVVGLVGSEEKGRFAKAQGADDIINRSTETVYDRVREITQGRGVDVILDPVAGTSFPANFALLAPFGLVVLYGVIDGWPDLNVLSPMREHFNISPALRLFTMHSFDDQPAHRKQTMQTLLRYLQAGSIQPVIYDRIPLCDAAKAHALFESGRVMGKLLLKP